jgi:hypothetical protein
MSTAALAEEGVSEPTVNSTEDIDFKPIEETALY